MAQTAVTYQTTPKGDQQCSNCSLFQPPSACTLVDGTISPSRMVKILGQEGRLSTISARAGSR